MRAFVLLLILSFGFRAVALSSTSRALLDIATQLDTEGQTAATVKTLESKPHASLVQAVREGLTTADYSAVAAKTASALNLTEVVPDLEKAFEKKADWHFVVALGDLANEAQKKKLAGSWSSQFSKVDSVTRVAMFETLSTWGLPLSSDAFTAALNDKYPGVRIAAGRAFSRTRTKLPVSEQIARYRRLFAAQPYQVRLNAMIDFSSIADRSALIPAIDASFRKACATEKKNDVRDECESLLRGAK